MAIETTPVLQNQITEIPWREQLPGINPELLKDVPKTVLENRQLLLQYFRDAGVKLNHLSFKGERIKTLSAEIPGWEEQGDEIERFSPLTEEEERRLEALYREMAHEVPQLVGVQSEDGTGGGARDLLRDAEKYVQEYLRAHPNEAGGGADDFTTADIWDQMFTMEVNEKKEENEAKYMRILASLKDPESIMMAIAYYYTDLYGQKLVKAMGVYKQGMDDQQQMVQKMVFDGASTAQIARANAEMSRGQSFNSIAMQTIQSLRAQIDQVQNVARSVLDNIQSYESQLINYIGRGQ